MVGKKSKMRLYEQVYIDLYPDEFIAREQSKMNTATLLVQSNTTYSFSSIWHQFQHRHLIRVEWTSPFVNIKKEKKKEKKGLQGKGLFRKWFSTNLIV